MASSDIRLKLEDRLRAAGVEVPDETASGLAAYFGLITKWNRRLNLTALELEPASSEAVDRLIVEPVCAAQFIGLAEGMLIDIGSGGGSPAIPLKLCAPMVRLVMVEAREKKAAFLRDASRQLGLQDVDVANCRFEQLKERPDIHHRADFVSVRAVRPDDSLWDAISAVLRPGGRVMWFTSDETRESSVPSWLQSGLSHSLPGTAKLNILTRTTYS